MDSRFSMHPRNGYGIQRLETTLLRIWDIPRELQAIEQLSREFVGKSFPGVYILLETNKKAYIGETNNIVGRLRQHFSQPQQHITNWIRAIVINDGRIASFSDFNDTVVRLNVEHYLKILFRANKYQIVSQADEQSLTATQKYSFLTIKNELDVFLLRYNLIDKLLEKPEERVVLNDELEKILTKFGYILKISGSSAVDTETNEIYFIRAGSQKSKGWQITIRGKKEGSFIDYTNKGLGYLLVNRDGILRIPLSEIRKVFTDDDFNRDTIDIFIDFTEEGVFLKYHDKTMDVLGYRLIQPDNSQFEQEGDYIEPIEEE